METSGKLTEETPQILSATKEGIRHVVWDWNGTLFNDTLLCMELINGLLTARGQRRIGLERYREIFGFPVKDYYVRLGFDFDRESWERVSREFIDAYEVRRHECALREGALEALNACRAAGLGQSILSAYRSSTLNEIVGHFGLNGYFEHLFGLDHHYADGKLELGRRLIASLGLPPDAVLFVGDTAHDWEVAEALGTKCVLMVGGHYSERRLKRCGVPVVNSPDRIPDVLSGGI